jgi:putative MATE family efflux protein
LPDVSPQPNNDRRIDARFVAGSTMRHVVVMTASGSIGLSFLFLVDVLALFWISKLDQVVLIAAMGFAATIQFLAVSVSLGMMIAGVALVARNIGAGDADEARAYATTTVVLSFAIQVVLATLTFIFRYELLALTGAEGEAQEVAAHFIAITIFTLPLIAVGVACSGILRATGDAWRSMLVTLLPGVVVGCLDPILILGADLGVTGAAISQLVSRLVMIALGLTWMIRKHDLLARPSVPDLGRTFRPLMAIALPTIVTQASTPIGNWLLTLAMAPFGEEAVAGLTVALRLVMLVFGGIYGLSGAIGGIIGQNFGARRLDRVRRAYFDALVFCAGYTFVAWVLMAALVTVIIDAFGITGAGQGVVQVFCFVVTASFLFNGALFVAAASFNNLGKPLWATAANLIRDVALIYPLALAFGAAFGATGVMIAPALANVIAGAGATLIGLLLINRLLTSNPPALDERQVAE